MQLNRRELLAGAAATPYFLSAHRALAGQILVH